MNYINTTTEGSVSLFLNLKIDSTLAVASTLVWTMTKDGNDVADVTFNTQSANFIISQHNGYSQKLLADFFTNGTTLENNCFYALKATLNDVVVYRGKAYATDVETADVSIHNNTKYIKNNTTNEYVIIN